MKRNGESLREFIGHVEYHTGKFWKKVFQGRVRASTIEAAVGVAVREGRRQRPPRKHVEAVAVRIVRVTTTPKGEGNNG